jgi:hypothetical protein
MAAVPVPQAPLSRWAQLWHGLPWLRSAHAQAVGVTVVALQNGITVDTNITDVQGNFTLRVSAGLVILRFTTPDFTVEIEVSAPANTTLHLVVRLRRNEVIIDNTGIERSPIRCEGGDQRLTDSNADIIIDGDGEACIRATGNCTLTLEAPNILLTNCEQCVRAEGNTVVTLTASGDLHCDGLEDGVRAEGTADVRLSAARDLTIDAPEHGIRAAGNANVTVEAQRCIIHGNEASLDSVGAAVINTDGCEDLIVGEGNTR